METKTSILGGVKIIIDNFSTGPDDELSSEQQIVLTNLLADYLGTVNPTNNYPPVAR